MTELAYLPSLEAAYTREFVARVLARPPGGVVLDRTFFYPTGGGQANDRGTLRGAGGPEVDVVDVTKQGPLVVHRLRGSPPGLAALAVGSEVTGRIDWTRRHHHMRLHTGQHYLSARIFARYGIRTRRASLRERTASLDLESALPASLLDDLGSDATDWVTHPRSIVIRTMSRAEWDHQPSARSALVPLAAIVDPVRLIEIDGIDLCPCGGTHVRSTLEIGAIAIQPPAPLPDGGARVTFELQDETDPTPRA